MRIVDTELDYEVEDEIALRRYLGGDSESMEQWAQRVWTMCEAKSNEIPFEDENALPDTSIEIISRVYEAAEGQTWQERAKELWENKKTKRKQAIGREFGLKKMPSKEQLILMKKDLRYKTRDQEDAEKLR